MSNASASRLVIYVALAGNFLIAIGKFIAAGISGSAAMWSEGIHSLVDTVNEVLLLYGMHRAKAKPDRTHPFGHGRELYFWSFVVAVLVLALGAGSSFYEGASQLIDPHRIVNPGLSFVMLGVAALFEGTSWIVSLREFRARKGDLGYFDAFRKSKDPTVFTVLLEDTAALAGLLIAFAGLLAAQLLDAPRFDAAASIGIALVLTVTSILLARESKSLLIGETAHPHVCESIIKIADADPGVRHVNGVITVQIGPDQVLAALSAEFEDALTTPQIEACIKRIESKVKGSKKEITTLFIKPQTPETFRERREALGQGPEPAPGS